jgi:osmotically-inducible protein OsmY
MRNISLALILASAALVVSAGCSSTPSSGSAQSAGATAGRVVDDSVITAKVKSALVADETTKASQINVETFQGKVQLSGFVDNSEARSRAIQVARNVDGVKSVDNALELRSRNN